MPSSVLTLVLVIMIAISSIMLVWSLGQPIIDTAKSSSEFRDAEIIIKYLNNAVRETAEEGNGSTRRFSLDVPKSFEIKSRENSIIYTGGTYSSFFDENVRIIKENIYYITGSDVSCYEKNDTYILENSYVKFVFNKTTNLSDLNTARIILQMQRTGQGLMAVENSSVYIGGDPKSGYGSGYSELLSSGRGLPFCTAHYFLESNSSISYDIYYRLFAAADFITAEIRNIAGN